MSIQSEMNRISENIAAAYTAIGQKGGTLPSAQVSSQLAAAVDSIPKFIPVQRVEKSFTVAYDSDWYSYIDCGFRPDIILFTDFQYVSASNHNVTYQAAFVFSEVEQNFIMCADAWKRVGENGWLRYILEVYQTDTGFKMYSFGYYDTDNNWVNPAGEIYHYIAIKYTQ